MCIKYNGVNLLSNTTIWWIYIYKIYYVENNYMFRHYIVAIFRLYMKHLESSYTNIYMYIYIYVLLIWGRGGGGGIVGTRSHICQNGWDVWVAWRVHAVIKLCLGLLFIIDKCMVGIILCLIVLRNYTKV